MDSHAKCIPTCYKSRTCNVLRKNFSKQTRETRAYAGLLSVELKEVWDPLHSVMVVEGLLFSNLAVGAKIMQIAELEKQIPGVF